MTWGPFSAEAVLLDTKLRELHAGGRTSDAIGAIKTALSQAHAAGPSNMTYEAFQFAAMSDADLLTAYQRTDGESAEADALLAEIEQRGLDI